MSYSRDKTDGAGAIAAASRPARSAPGAVVHPSQVRDYRAMGMISTTALGPKYVGTRSVGGGGGNVRPTKTGGQIRTVGTFTIGATMTPITSDGPTSKGEHVVAPNAGFPPRGPRRPSRSPANPGRPSNGTFGFLPPSTGGKGDGKLPVDPDTGATYGSGGRGTFVTASTNDGGTSVSSPIVEADEPVVVPEEEPASSSSATVVAPSTTPAPQAGASSKKKLWMLAGAGLLAYAIFGGKKGR